MMILMAANAADIRNTQGIIAVIRDKNLGKVIQYLGLNITYLEDGSLLVDQE